ncbi:MAG: aconitase X [Notoacmeibacter sp.]
MAIELSNEQNQILQSNSGRAFAMDFVWNYAKAVGAQQLVPISSAHIDGCLYHGQVSLDFVNHLIDLGAKATVPTTLNVGSVDLIHPLLVRNETLNSNGRALMEAHLALGCTASFTCAPYQLADSRPAFGTHIAWGESNAICFANSVCGARTERYGDFIDLACAIAGFAPEYGLHLAENRRAGWLLNIGPNTLEPALVAIAAGHFLGRKGEGKIAAIHGLSSATNEDELKGLGAAAASTGAVGLFHAVGLTPEAPTLEIAFQGFQPDRIVQINEAELRAELAMLSTVFQGARLSAVSLGTPHFSIGEFERLMPLLKGSKAKIPFTINTNRAALEILIQRGWDDVLKDFGVTLVVDTCVYVTTILDDLSGAVMTNSGKMAYYAPANLGCEIALGSLQECVASAQAGCVVRL